MINKIFIDTSVFIRFLTKDDTSKYEECKDLFVSIEKGALRPYISQVVILEIIFVLTRLYSFPKAKVMDAIDEIYKLRNITVIEKTSTKKALKMFSAHKIKYQDCLIATQLPKNTALITYDKEFDKIINLSSMTPDQIF